MMLGQYATSSASNMDSRIFVYEVIGLRQNEVTAGCQSPIRSSHSQFWQVPFHRMNEEMRRITMLGGKVVSVSPLPGFDSAVKLTASTDQLPASEEASVEASSKEED